jgi:hypothetical protein
MKKESSAGVFHLTGQKAKIIMVAVLAAASLITFSLIVWKNYPDIPDHNRFITDWLGGNKSIKLYSLYYIVVMTLGFFQNNVTFISFVSIAVLVISVVAKFILTSFIFRNEISRNGFSLNEKYRIGSYDIDLTAIIFLIVLLICLAENWIYKPSATMALGYLPVNTWHNSTTIFLMPFAIWLFYQSYIFLVSHDPRSNNFRPLLALLGLTLFSVFIKPSYFFVFSIAFPLYYLLRFGFNRNLIYTGMVSLLSASGLLLVYRYVYVGSDSSVVIHPFYVWNFWSNNIPLAFLCSVVFPAVFLLFYFRETVKDHLLSYAWIQMVVAVGIFIMLSETGGREMHCNFGWQTIICNFILFFCTWILFLRLMLKKRSFEMKDRIILGSFMIHVLSGIVFLLKLPVYGAR